ncbi:GNAT family N-acetyltransferase [Tsukamurella soli]|uniref:GNAT family N-acetyltransferase n=1 Tax=Tsukamurella soli TaxID=644556 RepID=A0ABP8JVX1_9ACTN
MGSLDDAGILDNAAWHALRGPHAAFAESHGSARRYRPDFARYSALPDARDDATWRDLARLVGPGAQVSMSGAVIEPPPDWTVTRIGRARQMVAAEVHERADPDVVELTPADVPEIFALIGRTKPGPWRSKTIHIGRYLGIRHAGRLVAMAGERVRPPGWVEVSAVCTDEEFRGRGFASRLVGAVVHDIRSRGDEAYLHVSVNNPVATRLYEGLGFRVRRETSFVGLTAPA